jgi:ligand-binding sensor domain-containing protein
LNTNSFLLPATDKKKQTHLKTPNTSEPGPTVIKNFKAVALAPDFDTTLVSQYIRSIFQDSKGNLWFGTIGEGVVRYDVKTLTYFSNPDGFNSNTVYAINEDKRVIFGLGLTRAFINMMEKPLEIIIKKMGLNHIDISRKGILVDKSGNIWVGTHGGVFRYDPIADSKGGQSFSLFQPCFLL